MTHHVTPSAHLPKLTPEIFQSLYQHSIKNPDTFWADMAEGFISWDQKWSIVDHSDFSVPRVEWFKDARLNACYNCVDRHLHDSPNKIALLWEGDDPETPNRRITYQELYQSVCQFSHALKHLGIKKGDCVCLYMPMIPEAVIAMLACARIGAIHNVVFAGFSADALYERVRASNAKLVITADGAKRANKQLPLKNIVDQALTKGEHNIQHTLVIEHLPLQHDMQEPRDIYYQTIIKELSHHVKDWSFPPEIMDANDPLFILYTSGSTGKPKGVVHSTGGYLLYSAMTFFYSFDHKENDIFWCTADVGWITGHSYVVYGPLCNGSTVLLFEGGPAYPSYNRFWEIIDKHKVTIFYTAPTALRAIKAQGDETLKTTTRETLRILGTVGEPINPEVWQWYHDEICHGNCHISDTWWQTETGGHALVPLPGAGKTKAGSVSFPFFGIQPAILDEKGKLTEKGEKEGLLYIKKSWPGQMIGLYNDPERFKNSYFSDNCYVTGDATHRDHEGYYWITGRVDDVLNVSGHRLGTAEIESALVEHQNISEAAVVGAPHPIKGEGIYAYVILQKGATKSPTLKRELVDLCVKKIGGIAKPDQVYMVHDLPKTRSGKIMRRILRNITRKEYNKLGDTSTLANPEAVTDLIKEIKRTTPLNT